MTIWGRYQNGPAEKVDTCTKENADYLLGEYRLAFGPGWTLWVRPETKADKPSKETVE